MNQERPRLGFVETTDSIDKAETPQRKNKKAKKAPASRLPISSRRPEKPVKQPKNLADSWSELLLKKDDQNLNVKDKDAKQLPEVEETEEIVIEHIAEVDEQITGIETLAIANEFVTLPLDQIHEQVVSLRPKAKEDETPSTKKTTKKARKDDEAKEPAPASHDETNVDIEAEGPLLDDELLTQIEAGGNLPPLPPDEPPQPSFESPDEPDRPNDVGAPTAIFPRPPEHLWQLSNLTSGEGGINPNVEPSQADRQAIDRALYNSERRGEARGVIFGFIFANLWQRRQRKKLERRLNNSIDQQSVRTDQLEKSNASAVDDILRLNHEQERLKKAVKANRAKGPELTKQPIELHPVELKERSIAPLFAYKSPEQHGTKIPVEDLPPEARIIAERLAQIPSGHHLEQSAWHSIEVDTKTGRAVEQPAFSYGSEFKHEQQQEVWQLANEEVAAASGQLAVDGLTNLNLPSETTSAKPIMANVVNKLDRLESTIRETRPLITNPSDIALWTLLVIVVIAIVIVIIG